MTDLERRALLGDKEAQAECTAKGIILPCPCCGGRATNSDIEIGKDAHIKLPFGCGWLGCKRCKLFIDWVHGDTGRKQALAAWNTRPTPPIGRCSTCKLQMAKDCEAYSFDDDGYCTGGPESDYFCADHKPQETTPKPTCAACANFLGGGDWGLCCKVSYDLCYQDTPACENFKPREETKT